MPSLACQSQIGVMIQCESCSFCCCCLFDLNCILILSFTLTVCTSTRKIAVTSTDVKLDIVQTNKRNEKISNKARSANRIQQERILFHRFNRQNENNPTQHTHPLSKLLIDSLSLSLSHANCNRCTLGSQLVLGIH